MGEPAFTGTLQNDAIDENSCREDALLVGHSFRSTGRQHVFRSLVFGLLVTMLGGMAGWAPQASAHGAADGTPVPAEWGYHGEEGPANWSELHSTYATCSQGQEQSPVDIANPVMGDLPDITFADGSLSPIEIVNTGETIQVVAPPGHTISVSGETYELVQFHIHSPSEHTVDGASQALELHLVHTDTNGDLVVLAVLLTEGAEHAALKVVFDNLPPTSGLSQVVDTPVVLGELLPADRATYRYHGSLTTPPCSEGVQWVIFTQPVEVSVEQIEAFRALFPDNARPTQPLNDREVVEGQ